MEPAEVEVKFRCTDPEGIRNKLRSMHSEYVDTVEMLDIYLQHPCRDFQQSDEALRVRHIKSTLTGQEDIELTYKGPRKEGWAKTRVELVVKVDKLNELLLVLDKLGFKVVARIAKHREFYLLEGVEVSLDKVEDLGNFVEIEDKGAGEHKIREVATKLGLQELVPETYLELYLKRRLDSPSGQAS
ncbi:MAG: class IV adenylate cyclase [Infirmifilum sp.]